MDILGADRAAVAILNSPRVLTSPADTMKGAHKTLVNILGADRATGAILQCPNVLRSPADTVMGANGALVAHLGKDGMLLAVSNSPLLLRKAGGKIHQTAAAIKGLLGDCAGTDLLKEAPRLFQASATYIEANVDALCNAFDRELVLEVVRVRPILLHDRMVANKTVKAGMMHN